MDAILAILAVAVPCVIVLLLSITLHLQISEAKRRWKAMETAVDSKNTEISKLHSDVTRWREKYLDLELKWNEETAPRRDFAAEHDRIGVVK